MATPGESNSDQEPRTPSADLALIRAARRGDARAIEALMERARVIPRILAALNRRAGSPLGEHDVADLAQTALLNAWGKLDAFRGEGALESWFYGICRNLFLNALSRRGRVRREELDEAGLPAPSPQGLVEELARHEELDRILDRLDESDRIVVSLRFERELTFDEIAAEIGVSLYAARKRYYRAIGRLRVLLARPEPGAGGS